MPNNPKANRRVILVAVLLILLLSGCGQEQPTLSGGKPVSYWVQALREPDAKLRKQAVFKLGNAGPIDATVFPAVLGALQDADAEVRCEAILALLKFGPAAEEAIPTLTKIQRRDRDAKVRRYAARALAKLQGGSSG